ncbi:hypothetical protein [Leptospira alstonii]|uniref:hypothetical protein n=1 Tax=Leptospira alstonii TaxID=28452 RepID=UPI000587FA2B|nr:hypothetical protein [Leptospira alstonii]
MQDPIGTFIRIRDLYISYLETAFRIGDETIQKERRGLLKLPGTLCTEPIIEGPSGKIMGKRPNRLNERE